MRIKIPNLNNIRRFWLYAFIFLLGYENWNTLHFGGPITLVRLAGIVYFGFALMSGQRMFSLNRDNKSLVGLLIALWAWLLFCSLMAYIRLGIPIEYNTTFVQLIALYWLIVNEIRWEPTARDRIFLAFILGAFSLYVLINLGIGIQAGKEGDLVDSLEGVRRTWFMGLNPNSLGNYAACGFILSLYLLM